MPHDAEEKELASRIAKALSQVGFFIGHREVDDPRRVSRLISRLGLEQVIELRFIDRQRTFYIIEPSRRPCRSKCIGECGRGNPACISSCEERCSHELREKIAEALRNAR